ncbi:4Fe-4S binding protein [Myxococcota bacterium]|nr:4Fe-4S binding protein [Myxococcota bacterium]
MDEQHPLIHPGPFSEIAMGNTAIVRAMAVTGTRVVTAYPGSPTPEIAEAISRIPSQARPFYFEFSTNEKVATEVAFGASINGHLSCVFFKSVGLNVAADTFVQLSMMELTGGMVIVMGDDPGCNSSQNEQDNRHIARLCYTPIWEPMDPQEVHDMYLEAAAWSQKMRMPVILRLSTHVCHAKMRVRSDAYTPQPLDPTPRFDAAAGPYLPITKLVAPLKRRALEKLAKTREQAESTPFTRVIPGAPGTGLGVITAGLPTASLLEVLSTIDEPPDVLRLGLVHPLPERAIAAFLRTHKEVKILEELDDFLEQGIIRIAFREGISCRILGKEDLEEWIGEYTPPKVRRILHATWPGLVPANPSMTAHDTPLTTEGPTPRAPQMCPGCGHRSAFHAISQALADSDITVGDIGCHTLGFLPPYNMGQVLLCMGASPGISAGLSLFQKSRRVVAFIGDSTFFHAGIPGVINALFNRHDFTLIVMENGTTAMTGHQDHAGSGANFNGPVQSLSIRDLLVSLGATVHEVDTYAQGKLTQLVREANEAGGFQVVIARHPCMLAFTRRESRKPGHVKRQVRILKDKCDQKHVCVMRFGCPSFFLEPDGGVHVNEDLCIGDGSCLQTCPSRAISPPAAREDS